MSFRVLSLCVVVSLCAGQSMLADVVFDWATVGNAGNANDSTGYGGVSYEYRISKHEVTNAQYSEFLNKVASVVDTNGLFNVNMGITQTGSGPFSYTANAGVENEAVEYVSFFDAMRFANWLENGQPAGNQGAGTTETGVYKIDAGFNEVRATGATFFIPTENEWYKAAYYDPRPAAAFGPPGDDNYWLYPTQSDLPPTAEIPPGGTNSANLLPPAFHHFGVLDVGAYTNSASFYGTYDQAGNVWELTETVILTNRRVRRGGSFGDYAPIAAASNQQSFNPVSEGDAVGFRVASVPEPSSFFFLGMVWLATIGTNWFKHCRAA